MVPSLSAPPSEEHAESWVRGYNRGCKEGVRKVVADSAALRQQLADCQAELGLLLSQMEKGEPWSCGDAPKERIRRVPKGKEASQ